MRRTFILCLVPLLAACNSGLGGYWSGQLSCPGSDSANKFDVEIEKLQAGTYVGELLVESTASASSGGSYYEAWRELGIDLSVNIDGKKAQRLDYTAVVMDFSCKLWEDGNLVSSSCDEMGVEISADEDFDMGVWRWDGADEISISDDDCDGEMIR